MSSEQSSEECSEDMHEDDQNKIIRLKAQAVQLYDKYSHKKFQVHVMNEAKLSKEQKARLWHWRLGHQPYELMKWLVDEGLVDEMEIKAVLNEDCATCDKARFKKGSFKRNKDDVSRRAANAPWHRVFIDGFGGQNSFGCPSYHGAVGGFVFICAKTGAIETKLYKTKDQFPRLLEQFLLERIADDYRVREIICDTDSILISQDGVEPILADYGCVIRPASAGTPEENNLAENAVGRLKKGILALMTGAPHIKKNRWGCCA